jgi:hypothetical protein
MRAVEDTKRPQVIEIELAPLRAVVAKLGRPLVPPDWSRAPTS